MNKIVYYVIGILVLIGLVISVSRLFNSSSNLLTANTVNNTHISYATSLIQLTDPPQFPNGTQSLILNYSNIALHEINAVNNTGFVNLNYSGTINLYNLTNITQTIGIARFPRNQIFNMIKLNISNAHITINNKTYNITVPGNKILIKYDHNLNSSYNLSLIDLSSSVVQIYSANQVIFILVPSARAIVIKNFSINATNKLIGAKAIMHKTIKQQIKKLKSNISITNAFISSNNNTTDISVTVKNNGDNSIVLRNLFINGYMQLQNQNSHANNYHNVHQHMQISISANQSISTISSVLSNSSNLSNITTNNIITLVSNKTIKSMENKTNLNNLVNNVTTLVSNKTIKSMENKTNLNNLVNNVTRLVNNKSFSDMINSIRPLILGSNNTLPLLHLNKTGTHILKVLRGLKASNKNWNLTKLTSNLENYVSNLNKSDKGKIMGLLSNKMNLSLIGDMRNFNMSNFKNMLNNVTQFNHNYHNILNFIISSNGSISLPVMNDNQVRSQISIPNNNKGNGIENTENSNVLSTNALNIRSNSHIFNLNRSNYDDYSKWSAIGYTLPANQSKTFSFDSKIHIGNSLLSISLIKNQTYVLRIIGSHGANININLTAS